MNTKIWLSSPHMGGNEIKYVHDAFDNNWVAPLGPNVDGLEQDICQFTKSQHCAALSAGTAAIHLALIMLGVQHDDYVICQSFTFSASANPITYLGAIPVFVDSDADSWNMCPNLLEDAIKQCIAKGKKPKAIIPVHLYGMSAKMNEIVEIANSYEIPIVEDAAEALGSTYNGKALGTFGKLGILSFNGNKIITTSGGGALISDDKALIEKARFLSTQARDNAPHYQHSHIGYNYRMSNICAGIGRGQMEVLNERVAQRRANFNFYKKILGKIEGITFHDEIPNSFSNRWLTCILVDENKCGVSREDIRLGLLEDNIESRPLWKPMHLQPVFKDAPAVVNGTSEDLFNIGLCLPSGSNLNEDELNRIKNKLISLFRRA